MKEEVINSIEKLFIEIAHAYKVDTKEFTYKNRKPYLEKLKSEEEKITKAFERLVNDLESYSFTRTDKELRFKAPDIHNIEMDRIKKDISDSRSNLKSFFEDDYLIRLIDQIIC